MFAFDTNILTGILLGNASFVRRASAIPVHCQSLPVVVAEEIMRGRLNVIRKAEAGRSKVSIDRAYQLFQDTFDDFRSLQILSYTSEAESKFREWRKSKIRISSHDLRIAAICTVHKATLITLNRRDFERVPGLVVEYWE